MRSIHLIPTLPWLFSKDGANILRLSKTLQDYKAGSITINLPIPWEYYSQSRVYDAVRDYLILQYIKARSENAEKVNFLFVYDLVASMRLTQLTKQIEYPDFFLQRKELIWRDILSSITPLNKNIEEKSLLKVKDRLSNLKYNGKQIDSLCKKLVELVKNRAHIVMTVDSDTVSIQSERILNFFESKRNQDPSMSDMRPARLGAEIYHYLSAEPHIVQEFSVNSLTHPCYASLQFRIAPILNYGESFIVIDQSVRESATAIFGAPLEPKSGLFYVRLKPVRLSESPMPLIAQFSEHLFAACLEACEKNRFPANFNSQYQRALTQYIEVQLLTNIPLHDPRIIRHIHLVFNETAVQFNKIDELIAKGISVSTGVNPYERIDMSGPSLDGEMKKFLITATLTHIGKAALVIAETKPNFLKFTADEKSLQFSLKITPHSWEFHQAQGAALLYCLGVRGYFQNLSALSFEAKTVNYVLPLTGSSAETGGLTDHDAYVYSYASLKKLLEKLLTRIFSVLLISKQNEQSYLLHNKPHRLTGKGATEEENQVKPLNLGEEKPYTIAVHWAYDRLVIEVQSTEENAIWVMESISSIITTNISRKADFIYIDMSLAAVFALLQKNYFSYQAAVIYDDNMASCGKLLLAFRMGFTTPGGHNNNPFSWIGALEDIEFGQLKSDWGYIQSQKNFLGSTQDPATIYYSLPTSCLQTIKEDEFEFIEDSLYQFDIWRLGNMSAEELAHCAKVWETTSEKYMENFGRAILLRPVSSIIVYLRWAATTLSNLIADLFFKSSDFTVKIADEYKVVNFRGEIYWQPGPHFGRIEISGEPDFLKSLEKTFNETYQLSVGFLQESVLAITEINPHALIQLIGNRYLALINSDPATMIQRIIQSPKNYALFLSQCNTHKICEILMLVYKDLAKIIESLGEFGMDFLFRMITEKLTLAKNPPSEAIFAQLLKESWGPLEKSNLHIAAENNNLPILKYLAEEVSIYVEARDKNWDTPLHYACRSGHLDSVKYFIKNRKADLFCRNIKRQSLWYVAALNNHWRVVEFLTKSLHKRRPPSPAKFNSDLVFEAKSEEKQQSILHLLCCCFLSAREPTSQFYDMFPQLLRLFAPCVNLRDWRGETVLHIAAQNKLVQIVTPLIEEKAEIECLDFKGETPLDKALLKQDIEMVNKLREYDAIVSKKHIDVHPYFQLKRFEEGEIFALGENSIPEMPIYETRISVQQVEEFGLILMLSQLPLGGLDPHILYLIMMNKKITAYWSEKDESIVQEIQEPEQSELMKCFVPGSSVVSSEPEFKKIAALTGYEKTKAARLFPEHHLIVPLLMGNPVFLNKK